jgi:hypothetical protein
MGTIELNTASKELTVFSWIITYGKLATEELTQQMRDEIEDMWNEPKGSIILQNEKWDVRFRINAYLRKEITQQDIASNTNPKNNYFRIEEFAHGNISFVDGLGCNTGYFKIENLYKGSTTAAHEYGHTLGLEHPADMDLRGKGIPGIMYPRGTLVDPQYQYDPSKPAGIPGGTMHPMHRKVWLSDFEKLNLHKLKYENGKSILGAFSNVWHSSHPSNDPLV